MEGYKYEVDPNGAELNAMINVKKFLMIL